MDREVRQGFTKARTAGRQPLLWAALSYAAGIVTGSCLWRPAVWWLVAGLACLISGAVVLRRRAAVASALGLGAFFATGALAIQVHPRCPPNSWDLLNFANGRELTITAHITREGNLRRWTQGEVKQSLDVETEEVNAGGEISAVRSGIRMSFYGRESENESDPARDSSLAHEPHYGDRIRFHAKI